MVWWHILLAAVIAKVIGKKLAEWAENPDIKREWSELVQTIDDAYRDGKISIVEIGQIAKEANDVLKELLRDKG